MVGEEKWTLPAIGRRHLVEVRDDVWCIRPRYSAVLQVVAYYREHKIEEMDTTPVDHQEAIYEKCLGFLAGDQRDMFENEFEAEEQLLMCSKLFRIFREIRDGVPRPNPGEEPGPVGDADTTDPTAAPSE